MFTLDGCTISPGETFERHGRELTLKERLGSGGFAEVARVRDGSGKDLTLKAYTIYEYPVFVGEAMRARKAANGIPNLVDFVDDDFTRGTTLLEFAPGHPVGAINFRGIEPFFFMAATMVREVLAMLFSLEEKDVWHGDIAPKNMIVPGTENVQLTDYRGHGSFFPVPCGITVIDLDTMKMGAALKAMQDCAGTPAYFAPEQACGKPVHASQQFGLATAVLEVLCRHNLPQAFLSKNLLEKMRDIASGQFPYPDWQKCIWSTFTTCRSMEPFRKDVEALRRVVGRMHAREPVARIRSFKEFLQICDGAPIMTRGVGALAT